MGVTHWSLYASQVQPGDGPSEYTLTTLLPWDVDEEAEVPRVVATFWSDPPPLTSTPSRTLMSRVASRAAAPLRASTGSLGCVRLRV